MQRALASSATYLDRAAATFAAMQRRFAAGAGLYYEKHPAEGRWRKRYASQWPLSQALAAALDLYGLSEDYAPLVRECVDGLRYYWDARPAAGLPAYNSVALPPLGKRGGGHKYYDDNAWTGLGLMRAYRMLGIAEALAQARLVFAFVIDGWASGTPSVGAEGGVYWRQQTASETNHDRNTVSNAPNAEMGLRLYAATGEASYLAWARRLYEWVNAYLRDPEDGLYWDHLFVDPMGATVLDRAKWSYNQGTMIGASALLQRVTDDPAGSYTRRAEASAEAALDYFASRYARQDPAFNAIFFRNLLLLSRPAMSNPSLRDAIVRAMRSYADWAWDTQRDPETGLFWRNREAGRAHLIDQAAMVQINACLVWDPNDYDLIV